ncbi:hypothetical protein [Coxiella-like endosymbiont]|uniref:hypothetical protein n=1 Tax=Coxiella-like endosymbiont TaxID=1592897 RepID=UPI00272A2269|nr:hypothetical protein [Coxiella-like endosymbiont]
MRDWHCSNKHWSKARKKEIIESRIKPTKTLTSLCKELGKADTPLFNANALLGIYGLQKLLPHNLPTALLDES